jgi:uncharacterized heparinase superfamily protein
MNAQSPLHPWPIDADRPSFFHGLSQKCRLIWQKNPLYSLSLRGKGAQNLKLVPSDPWPGSLTEGRQIIEGKFVLGSDSTLVQYLWYPKHLADSALAELHSFEWLRHLRAHGENSARRTARQLILSWIEKNQSWKTLAWRPDMIGNRLSNWIELYDFFGASADDAFRHQFFKSLYRQTRHLSRCWGDAPTLTQKFYALQGLIIVTVCLDYESHRLPKLLKQLDRLVQRQILADGGHYSRSPLLQLAVLRLLIDLKMLLRQAGVPLPDASQKAIQLMAPLVRLFRHTDGGIACFGPYQKTNSNLIDRVLTLSDVRGRPPQQANEMGYERASTKTGLILFSKAPTALRAPDPQMEEGTGIFTFEWSSSKRRLITYADLILQSDPDSVQNLQGIRYAQAQKSAHGQLTGRHSRHADGTLIEGAYQSHHPSWNFSQSRSLYLNNRDLDLRGEDLVSSHLPAIFAVRFVFHPDLRILEHGKKIRIEASDEQWTFISNCPKLSIDRLETNYPAQMLLLMGHLDPNTPQKIKWAFRAETR